MLVPHSESYQKQLQKLKRKTLEAYAITIPSQSFAVYTRYWYLFQYTNDWKALSARMQWKRDSDTYRKHLEAIIILDRRPRPKVQVFDTYSERGFYPNPALSVIDEFLRLERHMGWPAAHLCTKGVWDRIVQEAIGSPPAKMDNLNNPTPNAPAADVTPPKEKLPTEAKAPPKKQRHGKKEPPKELAKKPSRDAIILPSLEPHTLEAFAQKFRVAIMVDHKLSFEANFKRLARLTQWRVGNQTYKEKLEEARIYCNTEQFAEEPAKTPTPEAKASATVSKDTAPTAVPDDQGQAITKKLTQVDILPQVLPESPITDPRQTEDTASQAKSLDKTETSNDVVEDAADAQLSLWQGLCLGLGIKSVPESVAECKEALKSASEPRADVQDLLERHKGAKEAEEHARHRDRIDRLAADWGIAV